MPATNATGLKHVFASVGRFQAKSRCNGTTQSLGSFGTALEAALRVARHLGPEGSAAAAGPASSTQEGAP